MADSIDLSTLRREADDHLAHDRFEEAVVLLERLTNAIGPVGTTAAASEYADAWFKHFYCLLMLRNDAECHAILRRDRELAAHHLDSYKHFELASACCSASSRGDAVTLRSQAERFSQGFENYADSAYPRILARLDETIAGAVDLNVPLDYHDYKVTSFSTWKRGLNELVNGRYREALQDLLLSIKRYDLGSMEGDVLWSWFDAVLCHLFLDAPQDAKELYDRYQQRAASTRPRFETAASEVIAAYKTGGVQHVTNARGLIAYNWKGFETSQYPAIFDSFTSKVIGQASGQEAPPSDKSGSPVRPYTLLLARPAEFSDLDTLKELAQFINLGNTRPEQIKDSIQDSVSTLSGKLPFTHGQIYFCTQMSGNGADAPAIVGGCKMQMLVDTCWVKITRQRVAKTAKGKKRSESWELAYDSTKSNALEFGANGVLRRYWYLGIGTFQTQARLLFLLIHSIADVDYLFADLLTDSVDKQFPFYERVVRPLIGGIEYDDADYMRYNDAAFFDSMLGQVDDEPGVRIPLHSLPPDIMINLGSVRDLTKPAQRVLERYGFRKANKFDILDGGQYFETNLADLRRRQFDRNLIAKQAPRGVDGDCWVTFAPSARTKASFVAVRCRATIDGLNLLLPTEAYHAAKIQNNEPIKVLFDQTQG